VPSIKHRVSNVLAWAGFTFAPIALFIVIAVGIALVPQKTPPEDCETCEIFTWEDLSNSATLRHNQMKVGDWVDKKGQQPETWRYFRSRPLWIVNATELIRDLGDDYEDIFLPHASLWLLMALINYVMVGSLRLLPWRKIDEGEQ